MTGAQIVDHCRAVAAMQYEGDQAGAAQFEIELLRTKVLELSLRVETLKREAHAARKEREAEHG